MLEKIALHKKLITRAQCEDALAACRGAGNLELALKDYFISKNIISLNQMKILVTTYHALKIMKKNDLFGRMAVKLGHIGADLFTKEMDRQKSAILNQMPPRFIGEVWVENDVLSRNEFKNIILSSKKEQTPLAGKSNEFPPLQQDAQDTSPRPPSSTVPEAVLNTTSDNTPDFSLITELPGGMQLEVDAEGMTALVKKTASFYTCITPRQVKEQLKEQGIVYGIAQDEKIQGFIESRGFKENAFKIATGRFPEPGTDARIEYYFDTDYLKSATKDEKGTVDFKDRGKVPWVAEGTLLAEKFPMTESWNGTNIFNREIIVPLAVDLPLKFKSGVTPSDDRLKLYAEISGHPRLTMSGNIEVTSTFTVKNDINYKTGHLEYGGDIDVKGALKSGFQIKGQAVRVDTVDGGQISAQADVTVVNGINDAKVYARGNVTAKFIQNSRIYCLGNLCVTKEIVNCSIETSGAVLIPGGEVISSKIICNKGLYTRNLGTDKSVPNMITAGVDAFTKKEINTIERGIVTVKDRLEKIRTKTESLTLEIKDLHLAAGRIPMESDKAREKEMALIQDVQALKTAHGQGRAMKPAALAALNSQIRNAGVLVARLDRDLNTLFNRIGHRENQILDLAVEREELENNLEDLFYEQANFNAWMAANPGSPVVSVTGRVSPGTEINGVNASKLICENITNVIIKEVAPRDKKGAEILIHANI